ncbi:DUF1102 domain-containing protein [Halolamina sp. CBA1230]|uniref:DUF1102 domain-containing protein n=1 Tax=Halolamina sp. CBA1230 TaxID=1853690 RepID=UPI0009A22D07|nr:DUF1102 domain-containing protein [Halolamina sp. CBA1230]QKY20962.1 DUF1102 domain-containing protein [Halolamina sp. CBA1230]
MDRRKFIAGLGSLTAAGAAGIGTGAFTSVSADRTVSVSVADDSSAFLTLKQHVGGRPNQVFSSYEDGQLVLDFDETDVGGGGVNQDAVTEFANVFKLENHGTQAVNVWFEHDIPGVTFYRFDPDSNSLDSPSNAKIGLGTGAHMKIGVEVDTTASGAGDVDSLSGTVTIHASAESPT